MRIIASQISYIQHVTDEADMKDGRFTKPLGNRTAPALDYRQSSPVSDYHQQDMEIIGAELQLGYRLGIRHFSNCPCRRSDRVLNLPKPRRTKNAATPGRRNLRLGRMTWRRAMF